MVARGWPARLGHNSGLQFNSILNGIGLFSLFPSTVGQLLPVSSKLDKCGLLLRKTKLSVLVIRWGGPALSVCKKKINS